MSSDQWQPAKEAMAEAMALSGDELVTFLADLQIASPQVHEELVSLLASQDEAVRVGFLEDADDTVDQHQTGTFDPARTSNYFSEEDLQAAQMPPSPPQDLVGDDYELGEKIGQGGMGVVYRAYHRSLRRTVALKIIPGGGLRDEIDIARFHIEAEAAARLDHPGIIPVYDVGEHHGNHYYAMAYIEGPSLSEFVGQNAKSLAPRRAAELMEQVCHAVQYAHDRAVIHRDLKPANIMLEHGEVPRLADFGLAKNMHQEEEEKGLTMTGQVMGTPSYMAPEQAAGKLDEISNRTDVYSLGATLYALLAGKPPFGGSTIFETIRQVIRTEPEPLTQIVHTIPRDLQTVCEKCLAKRPEDRYDSADAVAEDLRRFLDGFPISARPLGPLARGSRWCQRNPVEAALLAITTTALIVGTIVSVRFGLEASRSLAISQQNTQSLRSAMQDTFVFASEDVLAQEPGMQAARKKLLTMAQQYYAGLVALTPKDANSQREFADAQFMLSKVQMALGQDAEAHVALAESLKVQQSLVAQNPENASSLTALAKSHNQLATLAQKNWQKLAHLRAMGDLSTEQANKQLDDWLQHSAKVVQLRKQVVDINPDNLESRRLLASAKMNEGSIFSIRGYASSDLLEQDQARQKMIEAQDERLSVLQKHPDEILMRRDLARGFYNLANTELRAADQEPDDRQYEKRLQLSIDDLTKAIEAYEELPTLKAILDTQLELTICYRERADAFSRLLGVGGIDKVVDDYQHAEKLLKVLTDRNPNVYRYRIVLAETQYNFCGYWLLNEQNDKGVKQLAKCRKTLLQAIYLDPQNTDAAEQFVLFTQNIVDHLIEKKEYGIADQLLQEAIQELLALRQDSKEYSGLQPWIDALESTASKLQQLRLEAESPDSVASAIQE